MSFIPFNIKFWGCILDTFPWSRYGIGLPWCWGLRVSRVLRLFLELRNYEWHVTCQIWTTWPGARGPTGAEVLFIWHPVSGLSLHFGHFWSSLWGTTLYSQPKANSWGKVGPWRWLDLTSSSSSLSPSSIIHPYPSSHLPSIRFSCCSSSITLQLWQKKQPCLQPKSAAMKTAANRIAQSLGWEPLKKPKLELNEGQQVRL